MAEDQRQKMLDAAAAAQAGKPVKMGASFATSVAPLLPAMSRTAALLDKLEAEGATPSSDARTTAANIVDDIPGAGKPLARLIGGEKYQAYNLAATQFNNLMLKVASGSQVTPSEADRWQAASAAQIWDSPEQIKQKAQFRRSFLVSSEKLLRGESFDKDAINMEADRILAENQNKGGGLSEEKQQRLEELRRKQAEGTLQ